MNESIAQREYGISFVGELTHNTSSDITNHLHCWIAIIRTCKLILAEQKTNNSGKKSTRGKHREIRYSQGRIAACL